MSTAIFRDLLDVGCVFLAELLLGFSLLLLVDALCYMRSRWLKERHKQHLAELQAERDVRSQQLRRSVLALEQQLTIDRDEISRQMTRITLLESRRTPPPC